MDYQAPLTKVRGLGSAKSGTSHWWLQRVTSVALLLSSYWLVVFFKLCLQAPYPEMQAWLQSPFNAAGLLGWILLALYHANLGLQVVLEDYVHNEAAKIGSLWIVKLLLLGAGLITAMALLRVTG